MATVTSLVLLYHFSFSLSFLSTCYLCLSLPRHFIYLIYIFIVFIYECCLASGNASHITFVSLIKP